MSVHIEWMKASETAVEIIAPGEDWIGAHDQEPDQHVLALSTNEVAAIEGTTTELRAIAERILALLPPS